MSGPYTAEINGQHLLPAKCGECGAVLTKGDQCDHFTVTEDGTLTLTGPNPTGDYIKSK